MSDSSSDAEFNIKPRKFSSDDEKDYYRGTSSRGASGRQQMSFYQRRRQKDGQKSRFDGQNPKFSPKFDEHKAFRHPDSRRGRSDAFRQSWAERDKLYKKRQQNFGDGRRFDFSPDRKHDLSREKNCPQRSWRNGKAYEAAEPRKERAWKHDIYEEENQSPISKEKSVKEEDFYLLIKDEQTRFNKAYTKLLERHHHKMEKIHNMVFKERFEGDSKESRSPYNRSKHEANYRGADSHGSVRPARPNKYQRWRSTNNPEAFSKSIRYPSKIEVTRSGGTHVEKDQNIQLNINAKEYVPRRKQEATPCWADREEQAGHSPRQTQQKPFRGGRGVQVGGASRKNFRAPARRQVEKDRTESGSEKQEEESTWASKSKSALKGKAVDEIKEEISPSEGFASFDYEGEVDFSESSGNGKANFSERKVGPQTDIKEYIKSYLSERLGDLNQREKDK